MGYQPIKFGKKQYERLKSLIRKEFGNISLAKGIYIISYSYIKHVPLSIKKHYRKKYYTPFSSKKRGLYGHRR